MAADLATVETQVVTLMVEESSVETTKIEVVLAEIEVVDTKFIVLAPS